MPFYDSAQSRRLAFHHTPGAGPGVVFLGGFKSDMQGSKAIHLEGWAAARACAFLRFDYSGHGQSSARFEEGCIGDWYEDAVAMIEAQCEGPQVLVGSSMGGWVSLLIARDRPDLVAGLVTIAAAPDFATMKWDSLSDAERAQVEITGYHSEPSDYGEDYIFTKRLFEDGANRRVLNQPLTLNMPTRMVQGTADMAVSVSTATTLLAHAQGPDITLELVKDKDHSFSDLACLALLEQKITEVLTRA